MTPTPRIHTRKRTEAVLAARAQHDPAFRAALLQNPKPHIEAELGRSLPDDVTVTVLEESPRTLILVLPAPVPTDDLSLDDLDRVAGGSGSDGERERW